MATFELTAPDGGTYHVDAPDEHRLRSLLQLTKVSSIAPMTQQAPPAESRGVLRTVDDYVRAAANGMTFGLADRFAAAMGSATGVGGTSGDYAGNLKS